MSLLRTELIGSIPHLAYPQQAMAAFAKKLVKQAELDRLIEQALLETIVAFEKTGLPVISDGEQSKPSFATYPISGLDRLLPNGVIIPFVDGHTRQLPVISKGPFRYTHSATKYLKRTQSFAKRPIK